MIFKLTAAAAFATALAVHAAPAEGPLPDQLRPSRVAGSGFNVVDLRALHEALGIPVLVVARRPPRLAAIRAALLSRVPGGAKKWALIEQAGPMEPVAGLMIQREGHSRIDERGYVAGGPELVAEVAGGRTDAIFCAR